VFDRRTPSRARSYVLDALLAIQLSEIWTAASRPPRSRAGPHGRARSLETGLYARDVGMTSRFVPKHVLRKEVIQPQVPLRLPCYDFTPVTNHSLGACLPCGLAQPLLEQSTPMV
jgi:hypothetical protein